ncbi:FUSC family protein [Shewanella sp. NFH-SH190041]|uniref:FUSC family protein n=1 Tax=Shewanella sp. NFH-SH190041 TaxID=2950245 RepID=UPI0021C41CC8|nr:FUSC family protein [Shewanella sp. NFH-SH190041]BDM64661.1 FUSC family protein [Shewanella sp. NFH-SH190041]
MSVFGPSSSFADFVYRHFRIIHALKLGFALFIAAFINVVFALPHFVWSMVTIVIIMMSLPQFGGALEKSLQRAIGTCLGSAYGVFLIACFHSYWVVMALLILAVSLVCFISKGRYSYAYLVGGFTIIIVIGDANHDISEAMWRTANILLGCLIAVTVSLFVLPIKAKQDWRNQLHKSLMTLSTALGKQLHAGAFRNDDLRAEIETGMKAVLAQKKLFFSLEWESQTLKKHKQLLENLAQEQVRMLTLMEILSQTRWRDDEYPSYAKINQLACVLQKSLLELAQFINGETEIFPELPDQMGLNLHQQLMSSLDDNERHHFSLTGYTWLLYQFAKALESVYSEVYLIAEAYRAEESR